MSICGLELPSVGFFFLWEMVAHELHSPEGRRWRLVATSGCGGGEASSSGSSSEVLTVLGGKASCRRKFVLSVHLVDEFDRPAALPEGADLSVLASVAYAHDLSPVVGDEGRPFLAEPPLLTTFNGVEFPAHERPTRLQAGGGVARASFKLALSMLSSKCDNRLFCIAFTPISSTIVCSPCYSRPIRSISRKRTQASPSPPVSAANAMQRRMLSSPASSGENWAAGMPRSSVTSFRQDKEDEEAPAERMSVSVTLSPRESAGGGSPKTSESCVEYQPPPLLVRPFRPYASIGACNVGDVLNAGATTTATTALLEKVQQLRGAAPQLWVPAGGGELGLEEEERSLEFIEASLREASRELQRRKEELRSKRRRMLMHCPEARCSGMAIYSK